MEDGNEAETKVDEIARRQLSLGKRSTVQFGVVGAGHFWGARQPGHEGMRLASCRRRAECGPQLVVAVVVAVVVD